MAVVNTVKGYDCTLSLANGGGEVTRATDVTIDRSCAAIEGTTRNSSGFKEFVPGLIEWSISVDMNYDYDDTSIGTLNTAFLLGTLLVATLTTPDESTGDTNVGDCYIEEFNRSEPLNDVVKITMKLRGTGALT